LETFPLLAVVGKEIGIPYSRFNLPGAEIVHLFYFPEVFLRPAWQSEGTFLEFPCPTWIPGTQQVRVSGRVRLSPVSTRNTTGPPGTIPGVPFARRRTAPSKRFATKEVSREITEYIEIFYNRQRRQARLGFLSPAVYEQRFYAGLLSA